jgi:enoyl-CoA hydratase/carnithine racemase
MREALLDALPVAADPSVREVRLRGHGPAFCSGDLARFGTGPGSGAIPAAGMVGTKSSRVSHTFCRYCARACWS